MLIKKFLCSLQGAHFSYSGKRLSIRGIKRGITKICNTIPGSPLKTSAVENNGWVKPKTGAIIITKTNKINLSHKIPDINANHTGLCQWNRSQEINSAVVLSSINITGKTGGTKGGIPVNTQDIKGLLMPRTKANFQLSSIAPANTGKNIGKKVTPNPNI